MSSPASILSEMHNKKLLQPLLNVQIPLLLSLLPLQLQPAPAPHVAPLPSTPAQREAADVLNSRNETRRGLYWDWNENLITLLWCCAESNTKILTSLNAGGQGIVDYLMSFLESSGLGLEEDSDGMDGVKGAKKGKKVKKEVSKKERVPLFVAVAAGQFCFSCTSPAMLLTRCINDSTNPARIPLVERTRADHRILLANPPIALDDSQHFDSSFPRADSHRNSSLHYRIRRRRLPDAPSRLVWYSARVDEIGRCRWKRQGEEASHRGERASGWNASGAQGVPGLFVERIANGSARPRPSFSLHCGKHGACRSLARDEPRLTTL